jgi:hypothetical protein
MADVYACSNPNCRALFDADTTLCALCKETGQTWTLYPCEVRHVLKVQACRPADRAMLSSEAGQELLQAAQEFLGDPRNYSGLETSVELIVTDGQVVATPSDVSHCDHGVSLRMPCAECRQG